MRSPSSVTLSSNYHARMNNHELSHTPEDYAVRVKRNRTGSLFEIIPEAITFFSDDPPPMTFLPDIFTAHLVGPNDAKSIARGDLSPLEALTGRDPEKGGVVSNWGEIYQSTVTYVPTIWPNLTTLADPQGVFTDVSLDFPWPVSINRAASNADSDRPKGFPAFNYNCVIAR